MKKILQKRLCKNKYIMKEQQAEKKKREREKKGYKKIAIK